jgi:hypothetical protein
MISCTEKILCFSLSGYIIVSLKIYKSHIEKNKGY